MLPRLLAVALLVAFAAGCYDVPQPLCGFVCGANHTCPDDYACNRATNRCELVGTVGVTCLPAVDAGFVIFDSPDPPFDVPQLPSVTTRTPEPNALGVSINTTIVVGFSEPVMNVSASTFSVQDTSRGVFLIGSVTYPVNGNTAVFTPNEPLLRGVVYSVFLNGIIDADFNELSDSWSFRTELESVPPMVIAQTPAPGATSVSLDAPITAQFSELVVNVNASSFLVTEGGIGVPGFLTNDGNNVFTYHPNALLAPNTLYTARLTGAITDPAGNILVGAPVTWTFTTGADTLPPQILSQFPSPDTTGLGLNTTVSVQFDEDVLNVSGTTFTVHAGPTQVPGTVSYSAGNHVAFFDPTSQLAPGTVYTVTLSSAITDAAGNSIAGAPVTWSFTTAPDLSPPFLSGRTPASFATNVPVGSLVTATFNEDVGGVSGSSFTVAGVAGVVSYSSGSRTATFAPLAPFAVNTTYTVTLTSAITDLASNPLSGAPITWTFTTVADATAPTVVMTTPPSSATGVPASTSIVVLFDEPVTGVTGATFRVSDGSPLGGSITSTMGGAQQVFTPAQPLPLNTPITVTLSTGITDLAGNPLAAPYVFTFTTEM